MWKDVISLIADLALDASGAGKIAKIIATLKSLLTAGIDGYQDIKPDIDRIIAALRSNGEITPEQLIELEQIERLSDAEFDKAAAAAGFKS